MVYSRGPGGAVVYATPVYEWLDSDARIAARTTLIDLSRAWSATLDEHHRATWRRYAGQHPRPDRWGAPHHLSGKSMFVSINAYWHRDAAKINWLSAPSLPPLHPPAHTLTADSATDSVTVTLPPATYDPPPAGLILWHFAGKPRQAGVQYHRTPYRYTGKNTNVPPWASNPWTFAWPWAFDPGQKLFSHLVAQNLATGALSTMHQTSVIAT